MRPAAHALASMFVLSLVALSGCDLIDDGDTYAGVVVDAETGAPVKGIYVALNRGGSGFGTYTTVDSDLTAPDGTFRLHADGEGADVFVYAPVYGVSGVYRPDYSSLSPAYYRDRRAIRIELRPL